MESRSAYESTIVVRGEYLPPIVAWKGLIIVGSFRFSRPNMFYGEVGFLDFLRRIWKVSITMSWSLPTSAPGNVLVLAVLILEWTVSSPRCSQSGCYEFHIGCVMSTFSMAYGCQGCLSAFISLLVIAKFRSLNPLSLVSRLRKGPQTPHQSSCVRPCRTLSCNLATDLPNNIESVHKLHG